MINYSMIICYSSCRHGTDVNGYVRLSSNDIYDDCFSGVCFLCELGQLVGVSDCESCPLGTFMDQNAHGNTQCNLCEPGTYAPDEGMGHCEPCDGGHYAAEDGQSECLQCLPGTYQPSMGETFCYQSHPGRFSPNLGSMSEQMCSVGRYSGWGAAVCLDCDHGYYCPGGTDRILCPVLWSLVNMDGYGYDHCLKSGT